MLQASYVGVQEQRQQQLQPPLNNADVKQRSTKKRRAAEVLQLKTSKLPLFFIEPDRLVGCYRGVTKLNVESSPYRCRYAAGNGLPYCVSSRASIYLLKRNILVLAPNTHRGRFSFRSTPKRLTNTPPSSLFHATSNEQRNVPLLSSLSPPDRPLLPPNASPSPPAPRRGGHPTRPRRESRPSVPVPDLKEPSTSHRLHPISVAMSSTTERGGTA